MTSKSGLTAGRRKRVRKASKGISLLLAEAEAEARSHSVPTSLDITAGFPERRLSWAESLYRSLSLSHYLICRFLCR